MADGKIKAVLFDLGETLLTFGRLDAYAIFRESGRVSYDYLVSQHQPVPGFRRYFWRNLLGLRFHHLLSWITGNDFDSLELLKKYGLKKGYRLSDEQWERVNWLWYEPLSRVAKIESDLKETLTGLKSMGLKLGIVSNTFVHRTALDNHLRQEGLLEFFEFTMYSYEYDFRKPDRRIFEVAAERIGAECGDIVYVGDRIDNDIEGALDAGMKAVMKRAYTNEGKKFVDGVSVIEQISELASVI